MPFSSFATARWTYGSPRLERYNGVPSVELLGAPAPGRSSGEAMAEIEAEIEAMVAKLPPGIGMEWTGISYQERLSGSQGPALYAISLVVVFLCLAALYESWSVPFSVMLVVPLGVLGALVFAGVRGLANDVYFQVGLLTTIGLSAKNAILIVEFAKDLQDRGHELVEATAMAARQRLRPIIMTSLALQHRESLLLSGDCGRRRPQRPFGRAHALRKWLLNGRTSGPSGPIAGGRRRVELDRLILPGRRTSSVPETASPAPGLEP